MLAPGKTFFHIEYTVPRNAQALKCVTSQSADILNRNTKLNDSSLDGRT